MPLHRRNRTAATQAAGEKNRVSGHTTAPGIAAAANVSAEHQRHWSRYWGRLLVRVVSDMHSQVFKWGAVTYHAPASGGGLKSFLGMLRPCRHVCELDSITWIPVRPAIRAGACGLAAVAASLLPADARAARAYVSNEDDAPSRSSIRQR